MHHTQEHTHRWEVKKASTETWKERGLNTVNKQEAPSKYYQQQRALPHVEGNISDVIVLHFSIFSCVYCFLFLGSFSQDFVFSYAE